MSLPICFSGISGADNAKSANFFDDHNICKNSKQRWYVTCSSHVFTNPESTKIFNKTDSFYSFICDVYLVRQIKSPIPLFTNPLFFYWNIYLLIFFWIEIIKIIIHQNLLKNIRGLVKINRWFDVTDKIVNTNCFFVRNHVKLLHVYKSRRGFSKGTVLCGGY